MKKEIKNIKYILLPIILLLDFYLYGLIVGLISEKADIAVLIGFSSLLCLVIFNYVTIKLIITKKQTK
jgi:hypothetical protein